jgi:hypothetical protein
MKERRRTSAIVYVAHSKTFLQDRKLHLLVFPDETAYHFFEGREIQSQCDIPAVLLKRPLFGGIVKICRKYERLEPEDSFFIPISSEDFESGALVFSKGNMICQKCKENYAANQRISEALLDEIEEYIAKSKGGNAS